MLLISDPTVARILMLALLSGDMLPIFDPTGLQKSVPQVMCFAVPLRVKDVLGW